MNTLLLTQDRWDVCLDAAGDIAVAADPYALAQDVASACRVDQGECFYDTTQGVPLTAQILGYRPPLTAVRTAYINTAETVQGVTEAECFFSDVQNRKLTGQVQVTDEQGNLQIVGF